MASNGDACRAVALCEGWSRRSPALAGARSSLGVPAGRPEPATQFSRFAPVNSTSSLVPKACPPPPGLNLGNAHRASLSRRPPCRVFVRSVESRKLFLLQNQPFAETPGAAPPLVFEVNPRCPGTRMPEGLPKHREIIPFRTQSHDNPDTDSLGIATLKPVSDAERVAPAFIASASEKALIPVAWCQLIPDKRGQAA
jgi:hypothetical protein